MKYIISIFLMIAVLAGCRANRYGDFFLYRDDGTCKPKVVFLPMCPGEQIESVLIAYAQEQGTLFFYSQEEVEAVLTRNGLSRNEELSAIARYYCPADFVVEVLLIDDTCVHAEHLEIPVLRRDPQEHVVRLRLQVLDIRSGEPKMVLFEVMEERELVITRENYTLDKPSIYTLIAEKAAARIEDRVVLCQTSLR